MPLPGRLQQRVLANEADSRLSQNDIARSRKTLMRSNGAGKVLGFDVRDPYPSESDFFFANPHVAGMASEDDRITLNPYSKLSRSEMDSVARNEAIRLFMRKSNYAPDFELTSEQMNTFKGMGADYAKPENKMAARHTVLARILSGDPSVGKPSEAQLKAAKELSRKLPK
jgi:hypothetical protein